MKSARRVAFINGSVFSLGELLPWKGVQFQVIYLDKDAVLLQGIGLTGRELKRLMKARSNA